MNSEKTGLVLEGGGMRGVYSSGVLQFFMEKEIWFPYVIGVSMGACNAANYISRQPLRNRIVNIKYVNDPRYLSFLRLAFKGELFGMKFIFDTIPNKLEPFDYQTFYNNPATCITTVTDCSSGEAVYFEKAELDDSYLQMLQASSSLPFISHIVRYKGRKYMDGGMADSIPVMKSIRDGNVRNVIILTQAKGYRKQAEPLAKLAKIRYPWLKGLQESLMNRHANYNETMDFIDKAEEEGKVFVIRPAKKPLVGRIERDQSKLYALYDEGYADAKACLPKLTEYLCGGLGVDRD